MLLDKEFIKRIVGLDIPEEKLEELENRAFDEFYFYTTFPRDLTIYPNFIIEDVKRALAYQIKHMIEYPSIFELVLSFSAGKISRNAISVEDANSIPRVSHEANVILTNYGLCSTRISG